jgi:hypothetical protein
MNKEPDFYLASTEMNSVFDVRKCYIDRRLTAINRDDFLAIRVFPTIILSNGKENIDNLVLAVRFQGNSLFPINEWPMHVNVCKVINESAFNPDHVCPDDLKILFWGTIFDTFEAAKKETELYADQISMSK